MTSRGREGYLPCVRNDKRVLRNHHYVRKQGGLRS